MARRWAILLVTLVAGALAGCAPALETDQARLCRMALPALMAEGAEIAIEAQSEAADDAGLAVAFAATPPGGAAGRHVATCRFRFPGRPREARELIGLTLDGEALSEPRLYMLVRFWLATAEAIAADPAPLGDVAGLPRLPAGAAYALQMALDGVPPAAIYALLAAAYSLIYGLVGRINLAFGELAAAGGYAAAVAGVALVGFGPALVLPAAMALAAFAGGTWGGAVGRLAFLPLRRATGQQALVAAVGLAIALQELLRLAQGDRASWMSPLVNQPFALARAGDFVVVTTPIALLCGGFATLAALALLAAMRWSRWGLRWRAYADDPLAAALVGVSPAATMRFAFAVAGALAGLAGATMTAAYGAVGYGLAATLSLKALAAAVIGGVGSIPGAFLGGLLIGGLEALWSASFALDYRDAAIYALMVGFIVLRPGGLLGQAAPAASWTRHDP